MAPDVSQPIHPSCARYTSPVAALTAASGGESIVPGTVSRGKENRNEDATDSGSGHGNRDGGRHDVAAGDSGQPSGSRGDQRAREGREEAVPEYSVRGRIVEGVGIGNLTQPVPLDTSARFNLAGIDLAKYQIELLNKNGKVVCTEGPFDLTQQPNLPGVVIDCGNPHSWWVLAAAAAAGITGGVVAAGPPPTRDNDVGINLVVTPFGAISASR